MCIVIDSNVIPCVFNSQASDHQEFRPVFAWIRQGRGKIVYGGTRYKKELSELRNYLGILAELKRKSKVVIIDEVNNISVDSVEDYLSQRIVRSDFNDHHIVAILIISGCKLVCSNDTGAHALIGVCFGRARALIKGISPCPGHVQTPKIYSNRTCAGLLCDRNIAKCCQ